MTSIQFAALLAAANTDPSSLKEVIKIALGTDLMARIARKALAGIGIKVDANDSQAKTAVVR